MNDLLIVRFIGVWWVRQIKFKCFLIYWMFDWFMNQLFDVWLIDYEVEPFMHLANAVAHKILWTGLINWLINLSIDTLIDLLTRKLTYMYLANDVVQNSRRKGPEYSKEFFIFLKLPCLFWMMIPNLFGFP